MSKAQTKSKLTKNQKQLTGWKTFTEDGQKYRIRAEIRYDDECGNGHNTFAITGETQRQNGNYWAEDSCGCIHEQIEKHFPHLQKYIKWHLTSSDGPMHYIANTTYHASNRDYNGLLKGEVNPHHIETFVKFENFPFTFKHDKAFIKFLQELKSGDGMNMQVVAVPYINRQGDNYKFDPHYTFNNYAADWYKAPFKTEQGAIEWLEAMRLYPMQFVQIPTAWGEGKERDFEAARNSAVWPEATDEQLSLEKPELEKLLIARHENLMREFQKDMEELGFTF